MTAESYHLAECIVDSAALIYLAKLDALAAFGQAGYRPAVTPGVTDECARLDLAYRYPDAAAIRGAIREGRLMETELSTEEARSADRLGRDIPALGRGERETMAVALARGWPAVFYERRASAVGRMLGIETLDLVWLLFDGTPDRALLRRRIRVFATLVNMGAEDRDALLERADR